MRICWLKFFKGDGLNCLLVARRLLGWQSGPGLLKTAAEQRRPVEILHVLADWILNLDDSNIEKRVELEIC